jgi:hypothetical protein
MLSATHVGRETPDIGNKEPTIDPEKTKKQMEQI